MLQGPEGLAQVAEVLKTLEAKGERIRTSNLRPRRPTLDFPKGKRA